MSRLKGTLIDAQAYNRGRDGQSPQIDLSLGGQYGYQPNFGAYPSNTGYTPRNLIPILIEAPRGFQNLPNPQKWIAVLKSLIENQSKNITGLRTGINVEASERPVGGAGHVQSDPTNVTEEMSQPTHVWDERYGRPIHNFWQAYIRNLIAEPITKQPAIMTLDNPPTDQLADIYSFTTLYIEPDPLRRGVVEAWLVTNMFPTTSGVLESQMDPTVGAEVPELSVEFRGLPVVSQGTRRFAQSILDELNYVNAGPMQRPAFVNEIDANIRAAVESGYVEDLQAAAQSGVGEEG
jgi:hypothetical protein